jgi:uncharacterized protein YhhL (DUF1145 family)
VAARIPGGKALATVFVDRIFDVVTLVLFLMLALPFVTSPAWLARIAIGGFVLLTLVGIVLLAARLYTRHRAGDQPAQEAFVLVRNFRPGPNGNSKIGAKLS